MKLSVLIPAHNEEATIGQTLAYTCERLRPHELVVANVSSTDRTGEIARHIMRPTLPPRAFLAINNVVLAGGGVSRHRRLQLARMRSSTHFEQFQDRHGRHFAVDDAELGMGFAPLAHRVEFDLANQHQPLCIRRRWWTLVYVVQRS